MEYGSIAGRRIPDHGGRRRPPSAPALHASLGDVLVPQARRVILQELLELTHGPRARIGPCCVTTWIPRIRRARTANPGGPGRDAGTKERQFHPTRVGATHANLI